MMNISILVLFFVFLSRFCTPYQICGFDKVDRLFEIPTIPEFRINETTEITQQIGKVFKTKNAKIVKATKCWKRTTYVKKNLIDVDLIRDIKFIKEVPVDVDECKKSNENMIEISPNIWKTNETYNDEEDSIQRTLYEVIEYWKEIGTIETFDGTNVISGMESVDGCEFSNGFCKKATSTIIWDVVGGTGELCRYENIMSTNILIANNQVIIPELEIFTEMDPDDLMLKTKDKNRCSFTKPLLLENGLVIDFENNDQENVEIFRTKRDANIEYERILSMVGPPFKTKPMIKTLFNADKIADIEKFETNPIQNITILQEINYWNVSEDCFNMRSLMYNNEGNDAFGKQLIVLKCIRIAQYQARERERLNSKQKLDETEENFKIEVDEAYFSLFDVLLEKEFGKVEKVFSSKSDLDLMEAPCFEEENMKNVKSLTQFGDEQDEITRYGFTKTPISITTTPTPTTKRYAIHSTTTVKYTTNTSSKAAFFSTVLARSMPKTTTQTSVKLNELRNVNQTASLPTSTSRKIQTQTKTTSKPTTKYFPRTEFISTILPKSTTPRQTPVKINEEKKPLNTHQATSVSSTSQNYQKRTTKTSNPTITTTTTIPFELSNKIKENEKIRHIQQKTILKRSELFETTKRVYETVEDKYRFFKIMLAIDETAAIRFWINTNDIVARWVGDALSINPCQKVKPTKVYWNHQINKTCYENLPIQLENEQIWYKLPGSEDLMKHGKAKDCKNIRKIYKKNRKWENSDGNHIASGKLLNKIIQKTSYSSESFETYLEDEISYTPMLKQKYSTMFSAEIIDYIWEIDASKLQDLILEIKEEKSEELFFLFIISSICLLVVVVTMCVIRKFMNGIRQLQVRENIAKVISRVKSPRINQVNMEMENIESNDIFDEYPLPGPRR